jgi:hypothetical protein
MKIAAAKFPSLLLIIFYLPLCSHYSPVLERRKLSIREGWGLAQGHTAQPD